MNFVVVSNDFVPPPPAVIGVALMNTISWSFPGDLPDSVKVYRSRIAVRTKIPPFGLVSGDKLLLRMGDQRLQRITFSGDSLSLADTINAQLKNGSAVKSTNDDSIFIVSAMQQNPGFIEILGGEAAPKMALPLGMVSFSSHWELLTTVPATDFAEYVDTDGMPGDIYALSTVAGGIESARTPWMRPLTSTESVCVISGTVTNLDGTPVAGLKVEAKANESGVSLAGSMISGKPVVTWTNEQGKFTLPVLRGARIVLTAEGIASIDFIEVPDANFLELPAALWNYYKLSGIVDVDQERPQGSTLMQSEGGADPHQMPV